MPTVTDNKTALSNLTLIKSLMCLLKLPQVDIFLPTVFKVLLHKNSDVAESELLIDRNEWDQI